MLSRRRILTAGSTLAGAGISEALAQTGGQAASQPSKAAFNVVDYGAVPDGKTVNTAAFARVTKACADAGGGIINVPPGTFITGRMRDSRLQRSYGGNFDLRAAADLSHALFEHDTPGLFFRHVRGLRIRGLRLFWDDSGPDFFSYGIEGEEFRDIDIRGFEGRGAAGRAAVALRNGSGVSICDCRATEGAGMFLSQSGVSDQRLFANNDLADARQAFDSDQHGFTLSGNLLPTPGPR